MKKPLFALNPLVEEIYMLNDKALEVGMVDNQELNVEDIDDEDVRLLFRETEKLPMKDILAWYETNADRFSQSTLVLGLKFNGKDTIPERANGCRYHAIFVERPLHTIFKLDHFLSNLNSQLDDGGYAVCSCRTSSVKKELMYRKYSAPWNKLIYGLHYFWHRFCPKVSCLKNIYFNTTGGKNRTFHRVEILGRLYHAGFEVLYENSEYGEFRVLAKKVKNPITVGVPSTSPIAKLRRVGKNGKMITVYKFRTMYSYSEYLQEYVYKHRKLDNTGKFFQDYRVNSIGAFLRKSWLDELPMVINIIKGEMKLVGVRPLSKQFFELYSPEMQELRTKTKPGLLPPLYYEKVQPGTLEAIQESERRYCELYLKHPFATDWKYFWGIVSNILLNHKHSH